MMVKANIVIEYCPKCRWMIRAAWMQQELLMTFEEDIESITLKPSVVPGVYDIYLNHEMIFSREKASRFPEIKELKKIVRDIVKPDKSLGHTDN